MILLAKTLNNNTCTSLITKVVLHFTNHSLNANFWRKEEPNTCYTPRKARVNARD